MPEWKLPIIEKISGHLLNKRINYRKYQISRIKYKLANIAIDKQ